MDARSLRELELDGVARLYAPELALPGPAIAVAPPKAAPVQVPLRAIRVEPLDWVVVAGGTDEGPFAGAEGRLVDGMIAAIGGTRAAEEPMPVAQALAGAPRLVLVLGTPAARELLGREEAIETLRGTVYRVAETPAVVSFGPGELLEACEKKVFAWEDLLFARRNAPTP